MNSPTKKNDNSRHSSSPINNNNNMSCPSCNLPNATFSNNQRKKKYADRKCKVCIEKLLSATGSSPTNHQTSSHQQSCSSPLSANNKKKEERKKAKRAKKNHDALNNGSNSNIDNNGRDQLNDGTISTNLKNNNDNDQVVLNEEMAKVLNISMKKIDRVKKRFVEEGIDIALDKRKADRIYKKKTDGDFEAHIVALSCSDPPEGFGRWSLRLLADKAVELEYIDSISHEAIRRILKKRTQTLAAKRLVDSTGTQWQFCCQYGKGA